MTRVRGFIVFGVAIATAVLIAACGGGGGGGGGSTMNPPPPPPPASASPTVSPIVCPSGGCTSYSLYATNVETVTRFAPTPPPPPAVTKTIINESISVLQGQLFHGKTATDYKTTESDATALQTIDINTDNYIQFPAVSGPIVNIGFHSSDSNGVILDVQYLTGNGQIGQVPLTSGWTNNASEIISETDPDGTATTETINADGSYSLSTTAVAGNTTATQNSDGTGTATVPVVGFFGPGIGTATQITIGAQSSSVTGCPTGFKCIPYTLSAVGVSGDTITQALPAWYPSAPTLASDHAALAGVTQIPHGCVAPSFGTSAAQISESKTRLDTIFGISDSQTTDTWVTALGPVCERITETMDIYYDFTGQAGFLLLGGPNPIQANTISELMGLTSAARADVAHHQLGNQNTTASLQPQIMLAQARLERWREAIRKRQMQSFVNFLMRGKTK